MILLQMVDKNLYNLISTDHAFWLKVFKRCLNNKAFCVQEVKDPLYPSLRLWKSNLHGIPVHCGILRGDPDDANLGFAFDKCFTSYVRRAYALLNGTRCGMCGCRYRHDAYWSLRMRVCRLCMEANTVSSEELCCKYGVDFSDLALKISKQAFFFTACNSGKDDRVNLQYIDSRSLFCRNFTYLFWRPHLSKFLDLPALYQQQRQRKQAARFLSIVLQRRWILQQRYVFATTKQHYSIDCLVLVIRRNERKRSTHRYGLSNVTGGPMWSFPERPLCGHSKFTARNGRSMSAFCQLVDVSVDCVV
jgi:hypothetical protein